MDGEEILRIVDALHRDKEIDKELLFQSSCDLFPTNTQPDQKEGGNNPKIDWHLNAMRPDQGDENGTR